MFDNSVIITVSNGSSICDVVWDVHCIAHVPNMMWFKREPKPVTEKSVENGVTGKLKRKKPVLLQPTLESSERETSTESDKERRRYSDILDITVSQGSYPSIVSFPIDYHEAEEIISLPFVKQKN